MISRPRLRAIGRDEVERLAAGRARAARWRRWVILLLASALAALCWAAWR